MLIVFLGFLSACNKQAGDLFEIETPTGKVSFTFDPAYLRTSSIMPSVGRRSLALELKPTTSDELHKFVVDGGVLLTINANLAEPFLPFTNSEGHMLGLADEVTSDLPNSRKFIQKIGGHRTLYFFRISTGRELEATCEQLCIFRTSFSGKFGYTFRLNASDIASFAELDRLLRARIDSWLVRS
jgi:hypothetical protein